MKLKSTLTIPIAAALTFGAFATSQVSAQSRYSKANSEQRASDRAIGRFLFQELRAGADRSLIREALRVARRGDVRPLPFPLRKRIVEVAARPHSSPPLPLFSEADDASLVFQYYLLDATEFQPNIFTAKIPGINDQALQTGANAANGGLKSIGAVRVALEPKEGLPTDPDDPGAFIDMFTDISGLFVINNEAGWYEGWMIRDIPVPPVAEPKADGTAQYGTITPADAEELAKIGSGNNIPGNIFTVDGNEPRFPAAGDVFPNDVGNTVSFPVSIGSFNALQQSDVHAYWEFNSGTNWVFPHYELPFTGGLPGAFEAGNVSALSSVVPGPGPSGVANSPITHGDNPEDPRDPDRTEADDPSQAETRNRNIPSGLTDELLFDTFMRVTSFSPGTALPQRLFDAYSFEVAKVDQDGDGVISFQEAAIDGESDGLSNKRLFLSPRAFNRYAVTRELNDGLLAPRFAPSQRSYVLSGFSTLVDPFVEASLPRDADDR